MSYKTVDFSKYKFTDITTFKDTAFGNDSLEITFKFPEEYSKFVNAMKMEVYRYFLEEGNDDISAYNKIYIAYSVGIATYLLAI